MFSLPDAPMGNNWPLVNFDRMLILMLILIQTYILVKFKRTGDQSTLVDVLIYTESFRSHIGVPLTQVNLFILFF
jgi:hypothetical protein